MCGVLGCLVYVRKAITVNKRENKILTDLRAPTGR